MLITRSSKSYQTLDNWLNTSEIQRLPQHIICCPDAAYPFRTHSTPLECGRVDIPVSIDIALRWSAVFFSEFRECLKPAENTHLLENSTHMQHELSKF